MGNQRGPRRLPLVRRSRSTGGGSSRALRPPRIGDGSQVRRVVPGPVGESHLGPAHDPCPNMFVYLRNCWVGRRAVFPLGPVYGPPMDSAVDRPGSGDASRFKADARRAAAKSPGGRALPPHDVGTERAGPDSADARLKALSRRFPSSPFEEQDGGAAMGDPRPRRVTSRGGARSGPPSRAPAAGPGAPDVPLVELEVPGGPEEHWLREVASRWDVRTRFRLCRPTGPSPGRLLQVVELAGTPGDLGEIERHLRRRRDLSALTILALSPSRRFVRAVGPMPEACGRIFETGAICASCRFVPSNGGASGDRWTLIVPRTSRTIRTVARIGSQDRQAEPRILRMRRYVPPRTLTPRQAAALETAFRLGFYSFPRRTNLKEIARILHVSRATASEHLRRAEAKMLAPELPVS